MPTVIIQPDATASKDTWIGSGSPGLNWGLHGSLHIQSSGETRKSLIQFDLSSIPSNADIISATLSLYNTSVNTSTLAIHRSLVDWFEGDAAGSTTTIDGSTYTNRNHIGTIAWSGGSGGVSGTEYDSAATDSKSFSSTTGFQTFSVTQDVQDFIDGTETNRGWWIIPVGSIALRIFHSSDHTTADQRPKLTIEYTNYIAGTAAGTTTASGTLFVLNHNTLTLQPSAGIDTMINNSNLTGNYGASTSLEAGVTLVGSATTKGMIQFDLSSVPANAIIFLATLSLYCTSEDGTVDTHVGLRRALTQWYEGVKNGSAPDASQDGSTWNLRNANGSISWGALGGLAGTDYKLLAEATAFATVTNTGQFFDWNVTADVKGFLEASFSNYGWWIINQSSATASRKYFASSDNATAEQRPKLIIFYVVPEGSASGSSIPSGTLSATGKLSGASAGSSSATALIISNENMRGQSIGSSLAEGFLRAISYAAGQSDGLATVSGDITGINYLVATSSGISTATAHITGSFNLEGSSAGSSTALADPSFEGQLRGSTSGSVTITAVGYARAVSVAVVIGCNPVPLLYITDGTFKSNGQINMVNFLSDRYGYKLKNYRPQIAQYKDGGRFSSSPLSQGRRLTFRTFDNAIDVFELSAIGRDQDFLIEFQQELLAFQEAAADYWVSDWVNRPVYIVARAARETNTRYAVIHMMSIPELTNPYAQPFFDSNRAAFDTLTLRVERGHWLSSPPGTFDCVEISSERSWTVSGWQVGS